MKRNLKLLSGIIMASFISNSALTNIEKVEARISRNVVVNSSSNSLRNSDKNKQNETSQNELSENLENNSPKDDQQENTTETNQEDTSIEIDENEDENDSNNESESDDQTNSTTNILGMLNSDKNLTKEDIIKLSMPVSHSIEFLDEFKTTFPNLNPLRQISPLFVEIDNYLDVNSNETKSITKFLNLNESDNSINFSDQNNSNILLLEISDLLKQITKEINSELPSTIFSLTPTLTVFNDTYKILSLEYESIIKSNPNNQITLNILLKDTESKLLSLLDSIKNFKDQLPELIETLNELAESLNPSDSEEDEEIEVDDNSTENESTESDLTENENNTDISEDTSGEIYIDDETDETIEDTTEDNKNSETIEVEEDEEDTKEDNSNNELKEDTEENEDVDPNSVIVYFGEQGQELIFDEKSKKYYQIDPENPDSDELIEYTGNITKMTLAEYLDTDLYFDDKGNELIFDLDTNSYFLYDSEKDEFVLYSGEVTKKKVKDLLDS